MPRLFTGIEVPDDVGAALAGLRGGLPGARWMDPADYHVTLRFLGDVDADVAEDFLVLLAEARPRPPIPIVFDGVAAFGGDRPRAVFARVVPDDALLDLQAEHERLARAAGLAPETRKFTPHVTLARLGRGTSAGAVAAYLATLGTPPPHAFEATRAGLDGRRPLPRGGRLPLRLSAAQRIGLPPVTAMVAPEM